MHLQITTCVVFFVAPWELASELELVEVCAFVISQNPFLAERFSTPLNTTDEFFSICWIMGSDVVSQVLRHLESLVAPFNCALVISDGHVRTDMLS